LGKFKCGLGRLNRILMADSEGAQEAQQNHTLRSLMKGNILVLTVSRVIWSISGAVVRPYMSLYILALGGSKPVIGFANAMADLAGMFLYPLGGYIADKAGRAKLVGIATFLYASSFLFFIFAPSWEWLAVGMAYQQLVLFYMPALNALMADSIPVGTRGKILSMMMVIPEAVRIFIPYVGGWLIAVYTLQPAMRIGYTASFFLAFVVAIMRYRYLTETIEDSTGIGRNVPHIMKESYREMYKSIKWVLGNLKGYMYISIFLAFIAAAVQPFYVLYATEIIGLTAYQWGTVLLAAGLSKTLLSITVGDLVDKWGARKCMFIALIFGIPSLLAFTGSTGFATTVVIYICLIISNAFMWIASNVLMADTIPKKTRGRIMAALGQGVNIGVSGGGYARGFILFIPATIGAYFGGYIYDFNPMLPWLLQATILLVSIALTYVYIKEPETAQA
jgi:MFS family permease